MVETPRETWITGIGIVSCLGEGPDAHWQALDAGKANVESAAFAPYIIHPLTPVNFDTQIPKKGAISRRTAEFSAACRRRASTSASSTRG